MTWVVADHTAAPATNELSVVKGQQVEVIDANFNGSPEYCLVRLNVHSSGSGAAADGSGTLEGVVPSSVLKLAPATKAHRRPPDSSADAKEPAENNGKWGPPSIASSISRARLARGTHAFRAHKASASANALPLHQSHRKNK